MKILRLLITFLILTLGLLFISSLDTQPIAPVFADGNETSDSDNSGDSGGSGGDEADDSGGSGGDEADDSGGSGGGGDVADNNGGSGGDKADESTDTSTPQESWPDVTPESSSQCNTSTCATKECGPLQWHSGRPPILGFERG